jgi:hypothetical protein
MIEISAKGLDLYTNDWKEVNFKFLKNVTILDLKKLLFEKFSYSSQTYSVTLAFKNFLITDKIKHHQTLMDLSKKITEIFENLNATPLRLAGKITCLFKKRSNSNIVFMFLGTKKFHKYILRVPQNPSLKDLKKMVLKKYNYNKKIVDAKFYFKPPFATKYQIPDNIEGNDYLIHEQYPNFKKNNKLFCKFEEKSNQK